MLKTTPILLLGIALAAVLPAQKPELITHQDGHNDEVFYVCFSPDERQALSADQNNRLILWDLSSGKFVRLIETGLPGPRFLSFSADGLSAVAILADQTISAWDLSTGERLWSVQASAAELVSAQVSPDRKQLVTCFKDMPVRCWDLTTGRQIWSRSVTDSTAAILYFSADGATVQLRAADGKLLNTWQADSGAEKRSQDKQAPDESGHMVVVNNKALSLSVEHFQLFDFQNNTTLNLPNLGKMIRETGMPVSDFTISKDKKTVAVALGNITSFWSTTPGLPAHREGRGGLLFWDAQNDRLLHQGGDIPEIVNAVNLSADGSRCLSASSDQTVRLWDVAGGTELLRLKGESPMETTYRFTPGFHRVALTRYNGAFKTWDLEQRNEIKAYPPRFDTASYYSAAAFNDFKMDPTGHLLLTGSRNFSLNLWNTDSLKPLGKLNDRHHCLWVATALDISADGKKALVGSSDEWRVMSRQLFNFSLASVQNFIVDKTRDTIGIVTGGDAYYGRVTVYADAVNVAPSYFNVSLWDLEKKQSLAVFNTGARSWNPISAVRFSPDGRLALADVEQKNMAWNIDSGDRLANEAGEDFFNAACLETVPYTAATIETDRPVVTIWRLSDGGIIRKINTGTRPDAVCFLPSGRKLCTLAAGTLTEWDLQTGAELRHLDGVAPGRWMQYAPDSNFIVIRDAGTVVVRSLKTGKRTLDLGYSQSKGLVGGLFFERHEAEQISLFEFLPDGYRAVSATYDGTLRFWNIKTGEELFTIYFSGDNDWVITTPAGLFDASPGAMKALYFRVGTDIIELEQLKERYFEPGLLQKLLGFASGEIRDVEKFANPDLPPFINAKINGSTLHIDLQERAGGLGQLSLFINNKEVAEDINPQRKSNLDIDLAAYDKFYLPDTINTIALRSFNTRGWLKSRAYTLPYRPLRARGSGDTGAAVTSPLQQMGGPSLYALLIGTSDYAGESLDLNFADQDAGAMGEALQMAGTALFSKERVHIEVLSTAPGNPGPALPSKANIQAAFERLATRARPNDILIVYLSGHGVTYGQAEKAKFYYLTKDIGSEDLNDPEIRNNYTLSSDELTQWVKAVPALKQVMILDACNSGKVVEAFKDITARELNPSQVRAFDRMKDRTGMFILTGSAADKVSYEAGQYGQGLLTYSLLQGMSGLALSADKRVDVMTLFQYSRDKVPDLAKGIGGIQTPELAFPAKGESFDIGLVTEAVKIPLTQVKPVFIRNNFQDEEAFDDGLGLTDALAHYFETVTAKGAQAELIYVDVPEYENAYSIKGLYKINKNIVQLRGRLFKGTIPQGKPFQLQGDKNKLPELVEALVDKVSAML